MTLEQILPEIREGRGFRRANWLSNLQYKGYRYIPVDRKTAFNTTSGGPVAGNMEWEDLAADDWELEPDGPQDMTFEGQAVTIAIGWVALHNPLGHRVINLPATALDAIYSASMKVRGIKDSLEYRDPTAMEWYAAGSVDTRPTRLDWYKKGHRAGWIAYENALKEKV